MGCRDHYGMLCYGKIAMPVENRTYSTRAVASSIAFLGAVHLMEVCKVATWLLADRFVYHSALTLQVRSETQVGSHSLDC